jgi:hypothetical protein
MDAITSPLKAASDAAEKILQVKGILEFGDEIRELHANVVASLKAARIAELEQTSMQQEILALKREVTELKASKTKLERYELKRLPPGVFVYVLKEAEKGPEAQPYACVKCFGDGKIMPLQSILIHNGIETLRCSYCDFTVKTGHFVAPRQTQARGRDFDVFNP